MTDPRFTRIPGTRQYVLAGDTRHARYALSCGRIDFDEELADLPEVRALGEGDAVLDAGAFVGDTAAMFLRKGCTVTAFEPYRDAFDCMRLNVGNDPRALLINAAAGDGRPLAATNRYGEPDGNCGSRMVEEVDGAPASVPVDHLSLSALAFAKIDVEGCEPWVLDGMRETVRRCRPLMLIEAYDDLLAAHGFTRADLFRRLTALNYDWDVAIGDAADPRCDYIAYPKGSR